LISLCRRNAEIDLKSELRLFLVKREYRGARSWFSRSRVRNTMSIV